MKRFKFHWRDGTSNKYLGRDAADAFKKAGYGAGDLAAVDYWEEIHDRTPDQSEQRLWNMDQMRDQLGD